MKINLLVISSAALLMASCGTKSSGGGESVEIVFDYDKNYPQSELTLSDVADVEYIQIGTADDFLMSGSVNAKGKETYVSDNFILKKDMNQLYMFDRQGNPIRKIGRQGNGPGEYNYLQTFVGVDEAADEVFIHGGQQKILVYGLDGTFKRALEMEIPGYISDMTLLNGEEIICLNNRRKEDEAPYYTISRQDGRLLRELPIEFQLPYAHDRDGRMAYSNFFQNENGVTLFELRSDTIYRISPQNEIIREMVDVTKYSSPGELYGPDNAQFLPMIETDKYLFGTVLCSPWITPDVVDKYYVYDKEQKQWFTLKGEGAQTAFSGYAAINGQINLWRGDRAVNAGYIAHYFSPIALKENRDKWQSEKLSALVDAAKDDDNSILMLIRFK